jgi:hypothetical protein
MCLKNPSRFSGAVFFCLKTFLFLRCFSSILNADIETFKVSVKKIPTLLIIYKIILINLLLKENNQAINNCTYPSKLGGYVQ